MTAPGSGWAREQAEAEVAIRVRETPRAVFALARERGTDPDAAARQLARERLRA